MSRKKGRITFVVLGIIMSLGIVSMAYAANFSAPGTACVDEDGFIRYGGNAINFNAEQDAQFMCPIIRYGLTTTSLSNLVISVTDNNNGESVTCYVRSCGPISGCANSAVVSSGNAFTGTTSLNMGTVAGFTNTVFCTIPDGDPGYSGVLSYSWTD